MFNRWAGFRAGGQGNWPWARWGLVFVLAGGVMVTWAMDTGAWAAPEAQPAVAQSLGAPAGVPLWVWPLVVFALTLGLGTLAVLGGIGGSVLFVPMVSTLLPFIHLDFVRGAGLMVALTGALAAGPNLLRSGLAHLRLSIPVALVTSTTSIFGALLGLAMPAQMVQLLLGVTILLMATFMLLSRVDAHPTAQSHDPLARWLDISGWAVVTPGAPAVAWRPRRMALGLVLFALVGVMAGLFGIGAGWANVPVFNALMGVPLKIAVASSNFTLSITSTTAAWVYLNHGAILPYLVIPAIAGSMLGARLGARLLVHAQPKLIRRVVIALLLVAASRALWKGLGL